MNSSSVKCTFVSSMNFYFRSECRNIYIARCLRDYEYFRLSIHCCQEGAAINNFLLGFQLKAEILHVILRVRLNLQSDLFQKCIQSLEMAGHQLRYTKTSHGCKVSTCHSVYAEYIGAYLLSELAFPSLTHSLNQRVTLFLPITQQFSFPL